MLSVYESTTIHDSGTFYRIKKYWFELKLWSIGDGGVVEICNEPNNLIINTKNITDICH